MNMHFNEVMEMHKTHMNSNKDKQSGIHYLKAIVAGKG